MRTYVAIGIAAIWATSYINSLITGTWIGFEVSTPIMGLATPILLGTELWRRRNGQ